jgi:5-(carboxyamino)imidazole ribonucleotide mutase
MPAGVPVATVALNGGKNAGILAAQMIGAFDSTVAQRLADFKKELEKQVVDMVTKLKE